MRYFVLVLTLLLALPALAADYAREKKWADEVLPSVLVGDPVWLELANGRKYLSLFTEASGAKAGVIVLHGLGVHPDWGLIAPLRQNLPDAGYTTLSVQLPVLKADAKGEDYPPTFDEAAERIRVAVEFLRAKGYTKIVVVSHSLGSRMADRFFAKYPKSQVAAWVSIGASAALPYGKLPFPVLDLYGEYDLPGVLQTAKARAQSLAGKAKSFQVMAPKADHFFEGKDQLLLGLVRDYLDKNL
ncbi:MAG: alpha/beta fold hydrolase [Betaproteobacteria bacterium]|nr:alpha/beta fold hydrolase [Betaproteobacteria bacterium]